DEGAEALDPGHPAAERLGEQERRPAAPAGDVEHAALRPEPQPLAEQPDLVRARRILDVVVAFGDFPDPGHARTLTRQRQRATRQTAGRTTGAGRTRRAWSSSATSSRASSAIFLESLRRKRRIAASDS